MSFVAPVVGVPFLLDLMKLPSDMFHLFVVSSVYTDRIRVVLGGIHVFVFTVVALAVLLGAFRVRWNRAALFAGGSLALAALSVFGVRGVLSRTMQGAYTKDQVIARMQLLQGPTVSAVIAEAQPGPVPLEPGESVLERIRRRGVLRFAFEAQRIPFCFVNSEGELVGFDIELMHRLAETLGVQLELVPATRQTLLDQAAADHFDLAGYGFGLTSSRSAAFALSTPYLDLDAALVVLDHRRHELDSAAGLAREPDLTIGVVTDEEFAALLADWIPQAKIVRLDTSAQFFNNRATEIDALFTSAEAGSAMTLLYPSYSVVNPFARNVAMPLVLVLSKGDLRTKQVLDHWILLRQKNGVIDQLYDHWILGKTAERHGPRWSVARDVLGWSP